MASEFKVVRRVEFSETDMAGIVHYSNFFRYMEAAEHEFFRSLGFSVVTMQVDPPVGWPRVHAECDYQQPLPFEVARGSLTVVCVTHDGGRMRAAAIPKEIAEKIEVAPAEALKR